jgi:hypothetical protein
MFSRKRIQLIAGASSLVMLFSSKVSFSVHSGLVLNTADDRGSMLNDYLEKGDASTSLRREMKHLHWIRRLQIVLKY